MDMCEVLTMFWRDFSSTSMKEATGELTQEGQCQVPLTEHVLLKKAGPHVVYISLGREIVFLIPTRQLGMGARRLAPMF